MAWGLEVKWLPGMVKTCKCDCSYCKQLRRWHDGPPSVQEGQNELIVSLLANAFSFGCIIGLRIRTDTEWCSVSFEPYYILCNPSTEMSRCWDKELSVSSAFRRWAQEALVVNWGSELRGKAANIACFLLSQLSLGAGRAQPGWEVQDTV